MNFSMRKLMIVMTELFLQRGPKLRVPIKGSAFSTSVVDVC